MKPPKKYTAAKVSFWISGALMLPCWVWYAMVLWYRWLGDSISFGFGSVFSMFFAIPNAVFAAVFIACGYILAWTGKRTFISAALSCMPLAVWLPVAFNMFDSDTEITLMLAAHIIAVTAAVSAVIFTALDLKKSLKRKRK